MSAIAVVLAQMGHCVTGSDLRDLPTLARVRAAGVGVTIGHMRGVVHGVDIVVASAAIPESNLEWVVAQELGVPRVRRAAMLAAICEQAEAIAVAGTHGKTTSSAMLTRVLIAAGINPSYIIGGDVRSIEPGSDTVLQDVSSARWSGGSVLVVEADESDGTHAVLPIRSCLVTNIDTDHLDHFGSPEAIAKSFATFVAGADLIRVVNGDDAQLRQIASGIDCVTFGFMTDTKYRGSDLRFGGGAISFSVVNSDDGERTSLSVPLMGEHNAMNALGVFAFATEFGVATEVIKESLSTYAGVARRCDIRGAVKGASLIDDYAHLPAEINAVLTGIRKDRDLSGQVIVVFQPNRFNRMAVMSDQYEDAFVAADKVFIHNVYASGTTPIEGVTGQLVVDAVLRKHPDTDIVYIPERDELVDAVLSILQSGDVCVSMGCGDIEQFPDQLIARLGSR